MPAILRYIRPTDKSQKGWGHTNVDHDLLITGSGTFGTNTGSLFLRTDDQATTPHDAGADSGGGLDIEIKADQKIFIDGRYSYDSIDLNWFGVDAIADTAGTEPLYITNIAGQAKITSMTVNGIRNAVITGKYDPVIGTGHNEYRGHDGTGGIGTSQGRYGIEFRNDNFNQICLGIFRDQYGSVRKSCSDVEINYLEIIGGFAGIQIKADHISDAGYDHDADEDTGEVATMFNMRINNNYIHDNGAEGIYVGHTGTSDHQHSIHLICEYNRFCRTGREAVQAGRLIPNMANYVTGVDEEDWKSKIRYNIIMNGATGWLRANPDGGQNSQDMGMQLGCRNGGIDISYNVIGGGAQFSLFWQMDGSGDVRTGNYAWIGDSEDVDTHVWIHHNYFIGSRNSSIYCQKAFMDSVTNSYATIEDNYFDEIFWEYDALDTGASEPDGLITGNNNISYIDVTDNTKKQNDRTLSMAFSPTTTRLTETGTVTDTDMDLVEFINSEWDDANREYLRFEHWVDEVGAMGGGTQSGVHRDYLVGDIVTVQDGYFYECTSAHTSSSSTEPGVGGSWQSVWDRIPGIKYDDVRLIPGSTYHTIGIGLTQAYDDEITSNVSLEGDPNIHLVI